MSNLVEYRQPESAHWYAEDGSPRHDADLRIARKERLFPSVTSVLAIKEKPQLTNWKIGQMVAQALTMERRPGENDYLFIQRVKEADEAERAKAPDLGTVVHAEIARYITTHERTKMDIDIEPVFAWISEHVMVPEKCEVRFVSSFGYGGCIDYIGVVDGRPAIIDWKTQAVKKSPGFYDEFCWQLAAYSRAEKAYRQYDLYSVIIDTAHKGCYPQKWDAGDVQRGWTGFQGLLEAWFADRKYDPRGKYDANGEIPF